MKIIPYFEQSLESLEKLTEKVLEKENRSYYVAGYLVGAVTIG
jgi:hypothetical protein